MNGHVFDEAGGLETGSGKFERGCNTYRAFKIIAPSLYTLS